MIKKTLIKWGLQLALWLIQKGWDYVDKNKDGKWTMAEVKATAKDLDTITKKLYLKIKK